MSLLDNDGLYINHVPPFQLYGCVYDVLKYEVYCHLKYDILYDLI